MTNREFINPNNHPIQISGPDKKTITFKKFEKKILSDWFERYCPRYLAPVENNTTKRLPKKKIKTLAPKVDDNWDERRQKALEKRTEERRRKRGVKSTVRRRRHDLGIRSRVVGRPEHRSKEATKHFRRLIEIIQFTISNNIGVGILSYNRLSCIKRLLNSIYNYTDLNKTTIFVSDESTDKDVKIWLRKQKNIVLLDNNERIGIAGNSNRLMRCLERFEYKLILNDDVEILQKGWDVLYPALMRETGYHHFCMRQPGIHGASDREGKISRLNDVAIQTINERPHGAIIALNSKAFETAGYFDESFGMYGMEHVDWSNRISMSGIQAAGFHDAIGSDKFFKIYGDKSSMPTKDRSPSYRKSREIYAKVSKNKKRIYIPASDKSKVPEVTYVIPFQGQNRSLSVRTVLQNVRAQRFPRIEIIVVEQDEQSIVDLGNTRPFKYLLAKPPRRQAFTKAIAFNLGVSKASCDKIILHDADMIVHADYTERMNQLLNKHESCHVGRRVMYMDAKSTNQMNKAHQVLTTMGVNNSVGYFEGGSLGCLRDRYVYVGGFNEAFVGYGVEDCEFFNRLKKLTNMYNERSIDFLHLAHSRSTGWEVHHKRNKNLLISMEVKSLESRRKELRERLKKYGL